MESGCPETPPAMRFQLPLFPLSDIQIPANDLSGLRPENAANNFVPSLLIIISATPATELAGNGADQYI